MRPDGGFHCTYISSRAGELLGLEPETVVASLQSLIDRIPPQDRARIRAGLRDSTASMQVWQTEFRVWHPDRGMVWVQAISSPHAEPDGAILWHGFLSDITKHKRDALRLCLGEAALACVSDTTYWLYSDGSLLDVNDAACWLLGQPRDRLIQMSVHDLVDEFHDRRDWRKFWRTLKSRGSLTRSVTHRVAAGGRRPMEISASHIGHAGQEYLCVIARPIAGHEQEAAGDLAKAAGRYQKLLQTTRDGFWLFDTRQGRIIEVNESACRISGYTREELLAMTPDDLDITRDFEETAAPTRTLLVRGRHFFETRHRRKDGRLIDLEVSAVVDDHPAYVLAFLRDITPRKSMERELMECNRQLEHAVLERTTELTRKSAELERSEERFRFAMEATRDGIWDWQVQTGHTYCSPAYHQMLGYQPDELGSHMTSYFADLLHPADRESVLGAIWERIAMADHYAIDFRMRHKNGRYHWITSRGKVVERDGHGRPLRAVGTHTDITERKEAELALMESENRFREMADSAPVMICVSGHAGERSYFNKNMLAFANLDPNQASLRSWAEGIHADDFSACLQTYERALANHDPFGMDFRYRRHDGEYRWIHGSAIPRLDARGGFMGYIGTLIDITERKQLEEFFRVIVEACPYALLLVDAEGRIRLANSRLEILFGYGNPDLVGEPVEILVPEARRFEHARYRQDYLAHPVITEIGRERVVAGQRKDGTTFQAEIGLNPLRIEDRDYTLCAVRDVTERKNAERALRESEERLELALRGANLGLWDWEPQTGRAFFSDRWIQMLGYSREEVEPTYEGWARLVHPDDLHDVLALLRSHLGGEIPYFELEYRLLAKNGDWLWILTSGKLWERDPEGRPLRATGIHLDISARKALEENLREQQLLLTHAQRLTTAGELSASIVHELNQPLGAIASHVGAATLEFASLLDQHPALADTLNEILRLTLRAASVVRSIHDLVRRHAPKMESLDLADLIGEILLTLRGEFHRREIRVETDFTKSLPQVSGDRVQFQQVILNLILNAMEAMEEKDRHERRLCLRAAMRDDRLILQVIDTGPGIAPGIAGRVFEPFVTTKAEGIGIGLSLCRTILQTLGGTIHANSSGKGACFEINLPLST